MDDVWQLLREPGAVCL